MQIRKDNIKLEAKKTDSRDNHGQNILEKLWFLCEIAHYRKSSSSIFQGFLGYNSIKLLDFHNIS